ncbi:MAG: hypothetical protein PHE29_12160, partial [Tissierellia bacterium]|nr:hypothetical protein [Tissierellia bacterium]
KSRFYINRIISSNYCFSNSFNSGCSAITELINGSKTSAFKVNANMLLKTIESKTARLEEYNVSIITVNNMESEIGIANDNNKSLVVSIVDGKINIDVVGQNKWAGYRATGTYNNITVFH